MATGQGNMMKELFKLMRDVDKLTDGQVRVYLDEEDNVQESDVNDNEDNLEFHFEVKPNDGLYVGGTFKFKVEASEYPYEAPQVTCQTHIYHPNIDYDSNRNASVCVTLLSEDWEPEVGLDGCVMAILFLFYHPQLDDCLNPAFNGNNMELDTFEATVKKSMQGAEIDGLYFDRVIDDEIENISDDNEKTRNETAEDFDENVLKSNEESLDGKNNDIVNSTADEDKDGFVLDKLTDDVIENKCDENEKTKNETAEDLDENVPKSIGETLDGKDNNLVNSTADEDEEEGNVVTIQHYMDTRMNDGDDKLTDKENSAHSVSQPLEVHFADFENSKLEVETIDNDLGQNHLPSQTIVKKSALAHHSFVKHLKVKVDTFFGSLRPWINKCLRR